jgi:hypothetical protein
MVSEIEHALRGAQIDECTAQFALEVMSLVKTHDTRRVSWASTFMIPVTGAECHQVAGFSLFLCEVSLLKLSIGNRREVYLPQSEVVSIYKHVIGFQTRMPRLLALLRLKNNVSFY